MALIKTKIKSHLSLGRELSVQRSPGPTTSDHLIIACLIRTRLKVNKSCSGMKTVWYVSRTQGSNAPKTPHQQ